MKFHTIVIIYNPNSTGDGKSNAIELRRRIKKASADITVDIIPTTHAGHGVELAASYAAEASTVVVSSSGDGGYNEVINGLLATKNSKAATAVLPSGNANDHYNAVTTDSLVKNIKTGTTRQIDAIKLESWVDGKKWTRYAHSYVGFGITPKIGKELTKRKLNVFNEKWHTFYHLMRFKHVDISQGKTVHRYSSLVFSTISRMSKVIRLEDSASQQDGKMEVYETQYQTPWQLLGTLARASVRGLSKSARVREYRLRTIRRTMVQLDGEVFTLDAKADVKLMCQKAAIRTVL